VEAEVVDGDMKSDEVTNSANEEKLTVKELQHHSHFPAITDISFLP
jgi:hypothetical protein